MATLTHGNYSFSEPPFKDGDVVQPAPGQAVNCRQLYPDTEICKDVKTLTIYNGDFVNCKPQPTWIVLGGNWRQVDYCSHDNPGLVAKGLTPCAEDCSHRTGDPVWVDVSEEELREKQASIRDKLKPDVKEELRITDTKDADGVQGDQKFEVLRHDYKSELLHSNRPSSKTSAAEAK